MTSNIARKSPGEVSDYISLMWKMSRHSTRRSGISIIRALALVAASACHFPYGFSGGGLPPNIRTMAIMPFENHTPSPNVQQELLTQMRAELRRAPGVRDPPADQPAPLLPALIAPSQ